jgi:hypothetical protein
VAHDRAEEDVKADPQAMELALEEILQAIACPRETLVSLDVRDGGALVVVDVDLPEMRACRRSSG